MNELKGKRVLVTGAAKGIGRGIARSFAEAGGDLMLHFRSDPEEAEQLRRELSGHTGKVELCRADLASESGIAMLFTDIERKFGGLDVAVNNAGWDPGFIPLELITPELYYKLSDINIKGTLFCCLKEICLMKNCGGGCIINIGSVQQDVTVPGRTLYAMSKGAIHSITAQLALEGGPLGIRVNNILPGYIEVERMSANPEYNQAETASGIPVRRVGKPEDIGALCLFLASEKASFINGADITADGGVNCKLARNAN